MIYWVPIGHWPHEFLIETLTHSEEGKESKVGWGSGGREKQDKTTGDKRTCLRL